MGTEGWDEAATASLRGRTALDPAIFACQTSAAETACLGTEPRILVESAAGTTGVLGIVP